jgi:hypothetical protein
MKEKRGKDDELPNKQNIPGQASMKRNRMNSLGGDEGEVVEGERRGREALGGLED